MLKPLELPLRVRFWHFLRGLLFYNTVYWKRASDDLNPPTLTREERENLKPPRNLEIIRPREHPRAKIGAARGGLVSLPTVTLPPAPLQLPESEAADLTAGSTLPPLLPGTMPSEEVIIRRRRSRRRSNKVRASQVGLDPTVNAKASFFGWLFTGKKRH